MLEQIVLGAILVVMGGVQMWLRYGPWGKELQVEQQALASRRAEALAAAAAEDEDVDADEGPDVLTNTGDKKPARPVVTDRGSKLWNKWTSILGPLGILFGLGLMIWGIVGK
jgi:hypothetical protein